MIRVVAFLIVTVLLALGVVWLADRPGQVAITWLGYRTDLSVMVAMIAIGLVALVAIILWSLLRGLLRSPQLFSLAMRERQRRKGHEAISRGLIAIGAGDARAAARYAGNAASSNEPLALLLLAQTAQLNGDRAGADAAFRTMAERDDTRLLGLRGLFVEAQRRNDTVAARLFAEQAAKDSPALAWAGQAVLEFRCQAGDWEGAIAVLESHRKSGMVERDAWRRLRAVLLTARALDVEETERDVARALAIEAARLAPGLVPAAELAGRMLAEAGERRKAGKIIEAAWRISPHPDLATAYAHLRLADSARDRLARVQTLARMAPDHMEGALATARAALDAREFTTARAALESFAEEPTQRVAMLMAELEGLEGDEGRAREWMARALNAARDPAWTADGFVSDRWLPLSPVSGRLDAFQWKVPVADIGERVLIEAPVTEAVAPPEAVPQVLSPPLGNVTPEPGATMSAPPAVASAPITRAPPRVAPIIPLTQVPDDPGPEPDDGRSNGTQASSWQRIRQIFR